MNILYINPARIRVGLDFIIKGQPLNLITLAAMVPEHEAKIIDYKVDKFDRKDLIRELNHHDLVAITSMTPQIYSAFEIAKIAKEHGCPTIFGGYHPTLAPDYVTKNPYVDYVIRGEGEHTFKELVDFLDNNKHNISIRDIDGLSYKDKEGKIVHNKARKLEKNLDNFPLPRRELIDDSKYLYLGVRVSSLESSRGCPYSCKFCCIQKMWRDPNQHLSYRSKSIKRIMQEIYDVDFKKNDFIFFCEDNFTINIKRTKKILDTIIKSGINSEIYFSCQSRVDTLYRNPWLVELMYKAGMRQVFLGIESVHQKSLNAMNKRSTTPQMTREVVEMLQSYGISIFGGVIIGFPGETKKMVRQTIQYAKSLNLTCVQFTPITAFPGTKFYEEMKSEGRISSHNYRHYNLFYSMMDTDKLSSKELYQLVVEAYSSYYLGEEWLKMLGKRYCNPFGKFNWMSSSIPRFMKTVIMSGWQMLRSQGISRSNISEELKQISNNAKEIKHKTGQAFKIESYLSKLMNMEKQAIAK
ncbi:MAG: radical SAM protein [Candidatus Lokiarchaeota archaeon]|nr:radical SAM protein [Candidatus Lokiarchaeota archaeon]MBD3200725.1 radical SAM protein [Candidatus Lokiarchaeota archaeon]